MSKCLVCEGVELIEIEASERMFGIGGRFGYLHCQTCQALFAKDLTLDLAPYYPADYYAFAKKKGDSEFLKFLKKSRFDLHRLGVTLKPPVYFDWLDRLEAKKTHKIADIGCGNGDLLMQLSYCGFQDLTGFDPFINEEINNPNYCIKKIPFEEIEEMFDIVMFHHSFEHLQDPKAVFGKLHLLLKNGGRALIRVPVTDSEVWEKEKQFWFQLDAPRHLFIPHTKSIQLLCAEYGFQLEHVEFDSHGNQFWITELYKQNKPFVGNDPSEFFSSQEMSKFEADAKVLNQLKKGDQACFYLKKSTQ